MGRAHQIINATKMGDHALRLIGTTDSDGNGTSHEIADVDPIVLLDFVNIDTGAESPFRPHPHVGLTAKSFLPDGGTWVAWDGVDGESEQQIETGGLYYVHAGTPAFHHEIPSPDKIAAGEPVDKPFHKQLGQGGFIIGETEEEVRSTMAELAATAEQIKQEVPEYFPTRYL